ncbi:SGNH/GDSL hydrolase family protein [Streptomyces sp. TRM70308]|uniref:SGNH/GDSL hydrolase family protein n=1 Tax=Streptomyces sp. TRM70308 TaxID=3131932 RepID=UPI003CFDD990
MLAGLVGLAVALPTSPATATGPAPAVAAPAVRAPADPADRAEPLERLFDNRGVSDDASPGSADFDGAGASFSARDLRAAGWTPGRALDLGGTRLRAPRTAAGAADNAGKAGHADNTDNADNADNVVADGQWVRVGGHGEALAFLVAGSSPGSPGDAVTGTGTVRYADGSRSSYTLTAGDWRAGPRATKAVTLPHRNTPDGRVGEPVRLYAVTVPLRPAPVRAVELPADPGPDRDLHVFDVRVQPADDGWSGTWAASTGGYAAVGPWTDRTLRLVVPASTGGARTRVRLANTFADAPVRIGAASVAVRGAGADAAGPPVPLTFGDRAGVSVAAGAQAVSDPVELAVPAGGVLLVSMHLPGTVRAAPVHSRALQTSYASADGAGDLTGAVAGGAFRPELTFWPFLTGVDVDGGPGSIVALGDSITDGEDSTPGANRRWPDLLARRLHADGGVPDYGVLNHGVSANRVVTDRYPGEGVSRDTAGVSARHRLERDVLAQTGVATVVVFEGVNDLRHRTPAAELVAGLRALAERSRARGLHVVGATILPCGGFPDCTADVDRARREVNAFIRDSGVFDAVLDFDAALRDPARPDRMLPAYDGGDHLHPGDAGMRALADSVDLRLLVPAAPAA